MSVLRTRVTGPVMLPDGSAAPNGAKIIFTLLAWDKNDDSVVMSGPVDAVVSGGVIDVNLHRATTGDRQSPYRVDFTYFNAATRSWVSGNLGQITPSGAGPVELADLLAIPAPAPSVPDALAQALAAAASADTDAAAAAASAATASLYAPAYFNDLAALVANTTVWPLGQILNTRREGFSYQVLSPGAVDHNLVKGGGQKLRVQAGQLGFSSAAFGQPGPQRIVYPATNATRYTKQAFQDASGAWWTPLQISTTGPVEVWVAWGQSEMRGVTGSPANIGGDRRARDNVLLYTRGTTISGAPDGWYAVGPEDDAWPFASSVNAVGSPFYLAAAKRAEEIGGTVCIIPYAIGGAESGEFLQGGPMWAGLQASWSDALAAALPGRGMSLNGLRKTLADVMLIWQGSADADYKLGTGSAAATADGWVLNWRTIINSLEAPSGMSVPITRAGLTKIIFFEMLHGATSGGAPGTGFPTDSRNRDLHKLLLNTSSKRNQIAFVPMAGVNQATNITNPEVIGSFDNLHLNGAAYNEVDRRLSAVLEAFDPMDRKDVYFENANGRTIIRPDGTFTSESNDLLSNGNVSTADGTGSFRSSGANWAFPMPSGYAAAAAPHVWAGQCTATTGWPRANVFAVTTTTAQYLAFAGTSIAGQATLRLVAQGRWVRT